MGEALLVTGTASALHNESVSGVENPWPAGWIQLMGPWIQFADMGFWRHSMERGFNCGCFPLCLQLQAGPSTHLCSCPDLRWVILAHSQKKLPTTDLYALINCAQRERPGRSVGMLLFFPGLERPYRWVPRGSWRENLQSPFPSPQQQSASLHYLHCNGASAEGDSCQTRDSVLCMYLQLT